MADAVKLAKELKDIPSLANALFNLAVLAYFERNASEAERLASEVIELANHNNLRFWLAIGPILHGWARSALGDTADGISCIEDGIRDYRAPGQTLGMPYFLGLKAEALYFADRTSEALETIVEAEAFAQRSEARSWCAELYRLRGVFLAAIGGDEMQIESSFRAAISTARQQKSISLEKRTEASFAEYRNRKGER